MSADPSDIQAQLEALNRRRQLAEALAQQSGQPQQQQVVNGRVMDQGFAPALRGITSLIAQGQANRAADKSTQLQQQQQSGITSAIGDYQNAPPEGKAVALQRLQRLSNTPSTLAQSIIQQATAPKSPTILKEGETAFDPVTREPIPGLSVPKTPKVTGPLDPLSKLEDDFKNGRISKENYESRVKLLTTRAPNMYAPVNESDPKVESAAQRIARYDAPPIVGIALRQPFGQAVMDRVEKIHGAAGTTYHGEEFPTRQAAYKGFATGKQGDQVRAFNVGISHLNTAQELADALQNGDVRLLNKVSQAWATQTGSAAPTNFDTAKQVVKGEIVKAVVGGQASQHDREEALAGVDKASSPAQLKGAIQTAQRLMGGQLGGLKRQFEHSTGRNDFDSLLSPDAQQFLGTPEAKGDSTPKETSAERAKRMGL